MPKPNVLAQLQSQVGMGRTGGAASRASQPIAPDKGKRFAAMENAMLQKLKPNPTKVSSGPKSRQFKKAAGENFGQM